MKIEPEALAMLFESLILPAESGLKMEENSNLVKENKKLSLVFHDNPKEEDQAFLKKILTAINVEADDTKQIHHASPEICKEIITVNKGIMIVWGIDLQDYPKYQPIQKGPSTIIMSDTLSVIQTNQEIKAKLWTCLKQVFK